MVDTQDDTVGSAREEPEALTYTLTGTLAKVTADSIGKKFRDLESEAYFQKLHFQSLGVILGSVQVKNWSKFLQNVYKS